MRFLIPVLAACLLWAACNNRQNNTQTDMNAAFDHYKEGFTEDMWKMFPNRASSAGYHKYDSVLTVPGKARRDAELAFCKAQMDSLAVYKDASLSDNNHTDYELIKNNLEGTVWAINDLRAYEWDPSQYNVAEGFAEILNGTYDSLDNRLRSIYLRLTYVPAYYAAAKENIKNPTEEHRQLAIEQNTGGLSVLETDLPEALKKSHLGADEQQQLKERAAAAVAAMKDYAVWLKDLQVATPRSFRLGKELYAKKFEYDIQSGYSIDEIYNKAVAHKKELHENMAKIANLVWGQYVGNVPKPADTLELIRRVIDKISLQHTTPGNFQAEIEKQIPMLTAFVRNKNLLYLDPSKPLVVRKEPDYMAGVAGASINAPGPYDKEGNTYYNVGSMNGWSKKRAESYLREYNNYTLQILNIHEAIPGHYAQLVYSNQSPSIIKSVLGNGAMIEGWAVYSELMMLENGYGQNTPEMWLMYYKWNLRSTCNTILDYDVHVNNMDKDAAMHLLVDEAFQQQAEAEGKWRRVSLTQVQLTSYFTGFTEIYDLREEMKKKMGKQFNLKAFHEKFLGYGSAPVKYIREMMLKDLEKQQAKA